MQHVDESATGVKDVRSDAIRQVRVVCGVIALVAVVAGLAAHVLRDELGLVDDVARVIAGGLGLLGVLYAGVLFWWGRLPLRR